MKTYGRTDTGRARPTNQDAYVCGRLSDRAVFAVVCDGMGGANGGNIASAMAVKVISDRIVVGYRDGMAEASVHNLFESAVSAANVEIYDAACADPELRGMGTTVVAAILTADTAYIAHVGDSRAYRLSAGEQTIEQITKDHSVVQAMVEKGQLTQTEAKNHPRKHFITRALGVEETVECDYTVLTMEADQLLLICTDGLTNMVETDDIKTAIFSSDMEEAADRLIAAANMQGGSDNITVALLLADAPAPLPVDERMD